MINVTLREARLLCVAQQCNSKLVVKISADKPFFSWTLDEFTQRSDGWLVHPDWPSAYTGALFCPDCVVEYEDFMDDHEAS